MNAVVTCCFLAMLEMANPPLAREVIVTQVPDSQLTISVASNQFQSKLHIVVRTLDSVYSKLRRPLDEIVLWHIAKYRVLARRLRKLVGNYSKEDRELDEIDAAFERLITEKRRLDRESRIMMMRFNEQREK
jgi:hypothetical protein